MPLLPQHSSQPYFPACWLDRDERAELNDIAALRDMRLGITEGSAQLVRLSGGYGFEAVSATAAPGSLQAATRHRFAANVLIRLLVLATNPVAVGTLVLRRDHKLVYLPHAVLERRYGRAWDRCEQGAGAQR